MTARTVVVGGGCTGLLAARALADRGRDVLLLERSDSFGGLLRSVSNAFGDTFDLGTHYVLDTGIADLDRVLLEGIDDSWRCFTNSLPEGHWLNGRLNEDSGSLDVRTFAAPMRDRAIAQLMKAADAPGDARDLAQWMSAFYGVNFTDWLFRPIMRKLTGLELEDLAPHAQRPFSLRRLIAFDAERSIELKRSPRLDNKIAYPQASSGQSSIRKFYPRQGGVGRWVELLAAHASRAGAQLRAGVNVTAVNHADRRVQSLVLDSGERIDVDELYWTVPTALLLRAMAVDFPSQRPVFRDLVLCHMRVDRPIRAKVHWLCCYDPQMLTYRVTCYPNIVGATSDSASGHLTVEVLCAPGQMPDNAPERLFAELLTMGVLDTQTHLVDAQLQTLPNALPIETVGGAQVGMQQEALLGEHLDNAYALGRSARAHDLRTLLARAWRAAHAPDARQFINQEKP